MRISFHRCMGGIEVYVYVVVVVEGAVLLMLWMVSILLFVLM